MKQFRKKVMCALLLFSSMLLLSSCPAKQEASSSAVRRLDKAGPADAFVIALLPEQDVFMQKKRFQPLADYLSEALGMNVKTRLLESYDAVYNEMLLNKVDAAFFEGISYVVMHAKLPLDTIARPHAIGEASTYRGLIFALRGKGITEDIRTWKGKRIALISKSTTSGYLFPRWYLYKGGVGNFDAYFGKVYYAGSHDGSILEVLKNEADIGCSKDEIFNEVLDKMPSIRKKLVVLARSPELPCNTLAVREDKDNGLKKRLKEALIGMDKTPKGREALAAMGSDRFIETPEAEYAPVFKMLESLGIRADSFALGEIGRNTESGAFEDESEQ